MFTDDKSIENIQQLFAEFKKFLVLQKEYTKLELTEKLTILLSTLIMILVLTILGMVALFYLLFAPAYILEPLVGGLMVSFGIIAGINVLLIAIIYFFRRQLIISPMVNFLANLFLNDSNKK
ncbi:phage holin family protein [Bacteroides fragilis]|nr:phage holin family protein [Bacteroides fragilis]UVV61165.1 phage holin family protein [Bacteroides fragilis]